MANEKNSFSESYKEAGVDVTAGYKAVELAVKAANGEKVADVDTGSKWYNAKNIDNEDIAILLYD